MYMILSQAVSYIYPSIFLWFWSHVNIPLAELEVNMLMHDMVKGHKLENIMLNLLRKNWDKIYFVFSFNELVWSGLYKCLFMFLSHDHTLSHLISNKWSGQKQVIAAAKSWSGHISRRT